jgi:hypothetical protein
MGNTQKLFCKSRAAFLFERILCLITVGFWLPAEGFYGGFTCYAQFRGCNIGQRRLS